MKKITMSVAALALSLNMSAQTMKHQVFTQVSYNKFDVIEMINTIDEVLFWHSEDAAECECIKNGSYEEQWGSNYWLRVVRDELAEKISAHGQVNDYKTEAIHQNLTEEEYNELISCENCDEID